MFVRAAAIALAAAALLAGPLGRCVAAQTAPSSPPAAPRQGSGSIAGTVTADGAGTVLPRVRVVVRSTALPQPRVALTGIDGAFRFTGLPAGDYELQARRTGYVVPFAVAPPGRGLRVGLADGQSRTGVALSMQRAGTIPGRLLDEDGSPLAGATVEAVSLRSGEGGSFVSVASASTDDRGEFRLTGLAAGQYLVAARDPSFASVGDETGPLRYSPAFHPGVFSTSDATAVSVAAGEEARRVEFRIQIVRPARVRGTIGTPDRRPLTSGAVLLVARDGLVNTPLRADDVEFFPDGRFSVRNVPPGRYLLRARAEVDPKGVMWFSTFSLTVEGRDIDDVAVPLAPGATVDGRIDFADAGDQRQVFPPGLRVRLPFADGTGFGDSLSGTVEHGGAFQVRGVMTGAHYFALDGLPEPWSLHAVMWHGRNILDQPTSVSEGEQLRDVTVILAARTATIEGTVRDGTGRAAADLLVVTTPAPPALTSRASPRFRTVRTDGSGRFRLQGLPPGDYRVAAIAGVDELAAERREWLARFGAAGTAVTLTDSGTRSLALTAVPVDQVSGAATR